MASPRFPSPLIERSVRISRTTLSDWLHSEAHDKARGRSRLSVGRRLRLAAELLQMVPGTSGVLQALANHHALAIFGSAPEVRALPSTGVTRPRQYYDPVRHPPTPLPVRNVEAATLVPTGSPPITRATIPTCRAQYPGGPNGCMCRLLPHPHGLPRYSGGSASATSLSRPAQTSLTLRPAGLLNRPRRPLSRGFDKAGYPTVPLVSYRSYRQLSGWNLPPLVVRAFGAH